MFEQRDRQDWMSTLAKAPRETLEAAWAQLTPPPEYVHLRAPETGLVMVRGRAGGTGARFNLGEVTVTRSAVRLACGRTGHGYVAGRDARRAELAAVFDALLQNDEHRAPLLQSLIEPLRAAERAGKQEQARKAAATKVEFFTLARGD